MSTRIEPATSPESHPRRRGNLGVWVATELADRIARDGYEPGDPLPTEAEIGAMFAVSVRVVRDALRILASQGRIQTSQGKRAVVADRPSEAVEGYFRFVTGTDPVAIGELFEVRISLESRAAGLAAVMHHPDDLEAIRQSLTRTQREVDRIEPYAEADLAWHAAVIQASRNRFIIGIHTALSQVLRSERIRSAKLRSSAGDGPNLERPRRSLSEHTTITDAIMAGDGPAATNAMRAHLERSAALYAAYAMKPTPETEPPTHA